MAIIATRQFNEGDLLTPIRLLVRQLDGALKDISGATWTFTMKALGAATAKVDAGSCTFTNDGTDGRVHYAWSGTDLDTPGKYVAWFTRTEGGKSVNYPQNGQLQIIVNDLP